MLRGAISGFGEVAARGHLAGWRTRPGVGIAAIHDPASARRHEAINLVRNVRVYDDLELMLDGEALDFVDIASPPAFHAPAIRMALEAGVHVLVEKPLCLDPGEFAALQTLALKKSRVLMCVHNWKYSPAYRKAYELVSNGQLGRIKYLSLVRMRQGSAGATNAAAGGERWRLDPNGGGGILIDHGWHVFYLMRWLMGGVEPVSISARLEMPVDSAVDEVADLRVEFPEKRLAYSHLSWRSPVRRTSALVMGDEAMLEIEGNRMILTGRSGVAEDHSVEDDADDSYHASWFGAMADAFESAIAEGSDGFLARENRSEVEAALELYAAARHSEASGGGAIILGRGR